MNSIIPAKLESLGVDWLTVTTKQAGRIADWNLAYESVREGLDKQGFREKPAAILGYSGHQVGKLFMGERTDGWMVRLSSEFAETFGWMFEPSGAHTTRLDVQVTARLVRTDVQLAERWYERLKNRHSANGRKAECTLLQNTKGGRTLYIGSRSSQILLRLYDKGIQSGTEEAGVLWRYEAEFKAEMAESVAAAIYDSLDWERQKLGVLHQYFSRYNQPLPFSPDSSYEKIAAPKLVSDAEGTMAWLRGPVAKSVARMIDIYGAQQVVGELLSQSNEWVDVRAIMLAVSSVLDD